MFLYRYLQLLGINGLNLDSIRINYCLYLKEILEEGKNKK